MKKNKKYSRRWRIRKAYWTTIRVILSYWRLSLISKIRGNQYYQRKVLDLNVKNANRVKDAILELEGLFIKIGQLLSILTNFLPEAYHEPLQSLQDKVPPRSYEDIQKRIQSELGKPIDELFAEFNKTPIATASIGQAHRATLHSGKDIVVKVQHLNIEEIADVDLEIIEKLVKLASRFYHIKGIEYAYIQIRQMIEEELDFNHEAQAMAIVRNNLIDTPRVIIPKVYQSHSTERVMVTSFCEGVNISNIQQLEDWAVDKTDLTERLLNLYSKMVLEDGYYHADPHPGNILVQQDGTIVLIDFGAVSQVQEKLRKGIPRLIEAVAKNDTQATVDALRSMDFLSNGRDAAHFAEKIIEAGRHFIENDIQVQGMDISKIKELNPFDNSLFDLTNEIGLKNIINTVQVPKDYVLLNRTATLLLGIAMSLDNTLNPLTVVRPYMQELILKERGDITKQITNSLQKTLTTVVSLPQDFQSVLKKIERGQVAIHTDGAAERAKLFYALGQQLIYTLLMIASFVIGYWSREGGDLEFSKYCFIASGLFFILFWRAIRRANKMRKLV